MTKPLPFEARKKNARDRRQPELCRYCDDTGYVVAQTRIETYKRMVPIATGSKKLELKTTSAEVDEMGPCPFCERGFYEEFGDPESQTKAEPVKAPWGDNGFWQGRDVSDLTPRPVDKPLSVEENARHARELLARVTAAVREP